MLEVRGIRLNGRINARLLPDATIKISPYEP